MTHNHEPGFCGSHCPDFSTSENENVHDPEFWWGAHKRVPPTVTEPFRRNPSDINMALNLTPEAHEAIQEALMRAKKFDNIKAHQAGHETAIYVAIARLLDAGILTRPNEGGSP